MLAPVFSCAVVGLEGVIIEVEVDYTNGLPGRTIVGLPDTAVQESRVRVLLAIAPGFASPVFPSAGVALACVLWMGRTGLVGVALGSLLFNLPHALLIGQPPATTLASG